MQQGLFQLHTLCFTIWWELDWILSITLGLIDFRLDATELHARIKLELCVKKTRSLHELHGFSFDIYLIYSFYSPFPMLIED